METLINISKWRSVKIENVWRPEADLHIQHSSDTAVFKRLSKSTEFNPNVLSGTICKMHSQFIKKSRMKTKSHNMQKLN